VKISRQLYEKITRALHDNGVILHDVPVLELAFNDNLLNKLSELVSEITSKLEENEKKEAIEFLTTLVNNARKVRDGFKNNSPELRTALLSFIASYIKEWKIDNRMLINITQYIPEVYQLDNEVYILTDPNEAKQIVSANPEKPVKILEEYMKQILKNAYTDSAEHYVIPVLGIDIKIANDETLTKLLFKLNMKDKAINLVAEKLKIWHKILEVSDNKIVAGNIGLKREVTNEITLPMDIIYVVKYNDKGESTLDIIIKTSIGTLKEPKYGNIKKIKEPDTAYSAINKIAREMYTEIQSLIDIAKKNKFTVIIPNDIPTTDKPLFVLELAKKTITSEAKISIIVTDESQNGTFLNYLTYGESKIDIHTKIPEDKLRQLLEKYNMKDAKIEVKDSTIHVEHTEPEPDLSGLLVRISSLIKDVATEHTTTQQEIRPESYLAGIILLSTVYRNSQEALEEFSEATKTPIIEILSKITTFLSKHGIFTTPEKITSATDKLLERLVEDKHITFNENLDLIMFGEKIEDLLSSIPELNENPEIYDMIDILKEKVAKIYYKTFTKTPLEDIPPEKITREIIIKYLNINGPIDLATLKTTLPNGNTIWSIIPDNMKEKAMVELVKNYIEMKIPVDAKILITELPNGKTVWETLPPSLKWKLTDQLNTYDVSVIMSNEKIKLTTEDKRILASIICRMSSPSVCTKHIVENAPEILQAPKQAQPIEDSDGYYIDLRLYKVQVEKVNKDSIVFNIQDKLTNKLYKVTARTLQEAINKQTEEEYNEISN